MSERSGAHEQSEQCKASERVNEQANEQALAQYLRLESWLIWTIVESKDKQKGKEEVAEKNGKLYLELSDDI